MEWTYTESILQNKIGKIFEESETFYPFGSKRCYHAVTRDWLTNEIFRRVEPNGLTMDQYFTQKVYPDYLGKGEEIYISVPDNKLD